MKLFSAGEAEYAKVTPVQRKYSADSFPIRQMHQRRIRNLQAQIPITGKDGGNAREVHLIQRSKLEGSAVE